MLYFPPAWRVEESAKCARVSLGERLLNWMTRDESLCRSRMVVVVDAGASRQARRRVEFRLQLRRGDNNVISTDGLAIDGSYSTAKSGVYE